MKTEIESAGNRNWSRFWPRFSLGGMYETGGTQWRTRDVKIRKSVASQKLGTLIPISAPMRDPKSA